MSLNDHRTISKYLIYLTTLELDELIHLISKFYQIEKSKSSTELFDYICLRKRT